MELNQRDTKMNKAQFFALSKLKVYQKKISQTFNFLDSTIQRHWRDKQRQNREINLAQEKVDGRKGVENFPGDM